MNFEARIFDADVNVRTHLDQNDLLHINILHNKERYRYYCELNSSGGGKNDSFYLSFDVIDIEGEDHGEVVLNFPKEYGRYCFNHYPTQIRCEEIDKIVMIPYETSVRDLGGPKGVQSNEDEVFNFYQN